MFRISGFVKNSVITHLPTGTKLTLFDGLFGSPSCIGCGDITCNRACIKCIFFNLTTEQAVDIDIEQFEVLDE